MRDCPFCPLEKKSPWYLQACDGIKVVKDLSSKHFKYRILVVGSGKKWHRPIQLYSGKEISKFVELGTSIAKRHIKRGWAARIVEIDRKHFKFPDHFHIQMCME